MNRTRAMVGAGLLGLGATSILPAPAGAFPWGHGQQGTNMHSPTCNCGETQQAVQSSKPPVAVAKQNNQSGAPGGGEAGQRLR